VQHEFVSLDVASRLLGLTPALVGKRALEGAYGPLLGSNTNPHLRYVSTRGISLASGYPISAEMLATAKAGSKDILQLFPAPSEYERHLARTQKPLTVEQLAADVLRTPHKRTERFNG
jgi:hypothetical protein